MEIITETASQKTQAKAAEVSCICGAKGWQTELQESQEEKGDANPSPRTQLEGLKEVSGGCLAPSNSHFTQENNIFEEATLACRTPQCTESLLLTMSL